MRQFGLVLLALIILTGCGSSNAANENETSTQKDQENEIRQTSENYTKAFSSHDPEALLPYWDRDAVYVNPTKEKFLAGHDMLAQEFKKLFEDHADKLQISLKTILFPEPGKAVETGRFRITFSDGKPPMENAFRAIMINDGKNWLFQNVRQIPLESIESNASHLKELEWLVGNWIDSDEDVDIETKTSWEYKNFLIQRFTMKLYDQEALAGQQIIGWDPFEKQIRSWIFDSDGGVGEGRWHKKGDDWVVKMVYTLANGGKASSIQIYRKIDDHSYTWASEARDVNGEILPNISPIKIIKQNDDLKSTQLPRE